jgi:hypothetical protein
MKKFPIVMEPDGSSASLQNPIIGSFLKPVHSYLHIQNLFSLHHFNIITHLCLGLPIFSTLEVSQLNYLCKSVFPMFAAIPFHLICHDLIIVTMFGEEYKL